MWGEAGRIGWNLGKRDRGLLWNWNGILKLWNIKIEIKLEGWEMGRGEWVGNIRQGILKKRWEILGIMGEIYEKLREG